MQPSTWNDTNQHWIPQFLLKGFGTSERASQVYELDKQTGAISVRKVAEVASKQHLLTERDDELMRHIEERSSRAIGAIRKGNLDIGEDGRKGVDKLVWTMMLNDPYSGSDDEARRQRVIEKSTRKWIEAINRNGGIIDELDMENLVANLLNHDLLTIGTNTVGNIGLRILRLMGLRAYKPANAEFFTIGESPVMAVRGVANGGRSLLNPGSQVILPVSSKCLLVYAWSTETNVIEDGGALNKEQVRSLNSDYYQESNSRYMYGRNREVLQRSRLMSLNWTPRGRSTEVKAGWAQMQMEQFISQKLGEARDAEQTRNVDSLARELVLKAAEDAAIADDRQC